MTGELIEADPEISVTLETLSLAEVVAQMRDKFPDFVRACDIDAIAAEEFRSYGPVVRFQNALTAGLDRALQEVASRRKQRV